jgi:hypothetical protein
MAVIVLGAVVDEGEGVAVTKGAGKGGGGVEDPAAPQADRSILSTAMIRSRYLPIDYSGK